MVFKHKSGVLHTPLRNKPDHGTHLSFLSVSNSTAILCYSQVLGLASPSQTSTAGFSLCFPALHLLPAIPPHIKLLPTPANCSFWNLAPNFHRKFRLLSVAFKVFQDQAPTNLFSFRSCCCLIKPHSRVKTNSFYHVWLGFPISPSRSFLSVTLGIRDMESDYKDLSSDCFPY